MMLTSLKIMHDFIIGTFGFYCACEEIRDEGTYTTSPDVTAVARLCMLNIGRCRQLGWTRLSSQRKVGA